MYYSRNDVSLYVIESNVIRQKKSSDNPKTRREASEPVERQSQMPKTDVADTAVVKRSVETSGIKDKKADIKPAKHRLRLG